jgi:UDP-N-acetylglucosamine:LPS N-acetylglucosamine transferase
MKIVYYVSGHGFGHISRSFSLIQGFLSKGAKVHLVTERKGFLTQIPEGLTIREKGTDLGVAQKSSLDVDLEQTAKNIKYFLKNYNNLYNEEKKFLEQERPSFVFSDSSSFPFPISKELGIPSYFMGNFTWDYIYENYSSYDPLFLEFSEFLRQEYATAKKAFLLPFHCPTNCFSDLQKIGLVGRRPQRSREEVRRELGFQDEKKYLLFSFGAYGLDPNRFAYQNLDPNIQIVVSKFEGFRRDSVFRKDDIYYPDLVQACDFVVTKPGYGIMSESYFSNSPIIYTDRGDFSEYPHLVESLQKQFLSFYINQDDLYLLQFRRILDLEEAQKRPNYPNLGDGVQEILSNFF